MLEKTVEAYLVERVRALGGTAYKFTSPARASVPDRIVILPPGRIFFVEVKRPGGKLTRGQEREHEHLRRLGADVRVLDSIGAINAFLNEVQAVAADGEALDEDRIDWIANAHCPGGTAYPVNVKNAIREALREARAAVSPATATGLPAWFDTFLTNVCEIPDRNSPDGEPDAIIATLVELKNCALNAIEQCAGHKPATADERAAHASIRGLIVSDAYASSFQTMGQYRCALIAEIDAGTSDLESSFQKFCEHYIDAADDIDRTWLLRTLTSWQRWVGMRASQAAAPAGAREPVGSVRVNIVRLTREVSEPVLTLSREFEALLDASPGTDFRLYGVPADAREPFQARVQPWMMECFGPTIAADTIERNHRFLEEALELVQSLGCTASEAHQLVDYTFGRPIGEPMQEVGGVMTTLAALCLANTLDMHAAGEAELARISAPAMVEKIRAKQAAKPKHSPLPEATADAGEAVALTAAARDVLAERARQVSVEGWTPEHDDQYTKGELAQAASLYAVSDLKRGDPPLMWPWHANWWKPSTPRRNRVKATALMLAEIERLDRAEASQGAQGGKGGEA
ncbi:hypothetical protein [Burkholderia gladioli]|uniref:hypothetical protein n=1 Tax=Burkholderia gladioli TaxID=28095 RepID=UPI003D194182